MSFVLPSIGGGFIAHQTAAASFSNTRSISFDGSNDFIDCGNVTSLDSATAFSMSCWVFFGTGGLTGKQCFISSGASANDLIRLHKGNSHEIRFTVRTGGSGADLSGGTGTVLTENTWHHVAATYSSGTGKMYLDGSLLSTGTPGSAPSTGGDSLDIGRLITSAHFVDGLMDEVAIWDATLSDADIAAIYNAPNDIPTDLSLAAAYDTDRTSNLTHWWRMEEGSGSSVVNTANSGTNDGTISGATFSTSVPS